MVGGCGAEKCFFYGNLMKFVLIEGTIKDELRTI